LFVLGSDLRLSLDLWLSFGIFVGFFDVLLDTSL
jgi:hypothetical protein